MGVFMDEVGGTAEQWNSVRSLVVLLASEMNGSMPEFRRPLFRAVFEFFLFHLLASSHCLHCLPCLCTHIVICTM